MLAYGRECDAFKGYIMLYFPEDSLDLITFSNIYTELSLACWVSINEASLMAEGMVTAAVFVGYESILELEVLRLLKRPCD
jgi:hypothetical protein